MSLQDRTILVDVHQGDALAFGADVLALKYAQALYGLDAEAAHRLERAGTDLGSLLPEVDGFRLVPSSGTMAARLVLLAGVPELRRFEYSGIRDFARRVLETLAGAAPGTRHLAMTIHGPGYGLDEREAFRSQLAGFLDACAPGRVPAALERITIVEYNPGRAARLAALLEAELPGRVLRCDSAGRPESPGGGRVRTAATDRLRSTAGVASETKPHVFVAMPFAEEMDDVYHYGIQNAVHAAGYLCERADLETFTGDVIDWVKARISSAALIVAELTGANPNVYLEVGYAWGCGRPTVLIAREEKDLRFDVRGQRCLLYKRIRDLETMLGDELRALAAREPRAPSSAVAQPRAN